MKLSLSWLLFCWSMVSVADATDPFELLKRIRQTEQAQFSYQETRQLELASAPWQGQGYMLSGTDGSLVKLQLKPSRIIMAIAHEQMYYWDPEQQQRHTAPLDYADQAASQIKIFRSILQGDVKALQDSYDFSAEHQDQRWTLRLTPKPEFRDETPTFEISGDQNDQQRQINIRQADGEFTEYRMTKIAPEQQPTYSLQSLLLEATGN